MEKKSASFEEKLQRLDEIVDIVENKTMPLEESMKLFNEGLKLIRELELSLSEAESKLALLIKDDNSIEKIKNSK